MTTPDFTTTFLVPLSLHETFNAITNVQEWWSGLYAEELEGESARLGDEFTFRAAGGKHYSKQKLVELVPDEKIVWLVTESNLSFLKKTDEWTGTKLSFELTGLGDDTQVRFTHFGLTPGIECYGGCSSTWPKYFDHLLLPPITETKAKAVSKA